MTQLGSSTCDLCGLPLGRADHCADYGEQTLRFCCAGCKMVYGMLMEAADAPDPDQFRRSELYRRCVVAGVVPSSTLQEDALQEERRNPPLETDTAAGSMKGDASEILTAQWEVGGMWCPACAWVIQAALARKSGVAEAVCDFATDRLHCRYDPTRIDPGEVARTVQSLGYQPVETRLHTNGRRLRGPFVRLMVSALLAVNVMMLSWALYSGFFTTLSHQDIRHLSWPLVIMTTVVMVYGGGPLFRKAWWGLRNRAPGMEALVCLGAGSAYLFSLYNFICGSVHLYFDTASMLVVLVLLGKLLEARARARVRRDLEDFFALQPRKVRICTTQFPRGRFKALERLVAGDRFRVEAGEMVPADGDVVAGVGWADASAITGESRLARLNPGEAVTSGTRLVQGHVEAVARRVGPEALLGQMIAVIGQSLARRTPLESHTERWLALFVPMMVVLAAATVLVASKTGLAWDQAFIRGLTVLVVACPCAMGIAVPLARVAGISLAGRQGILVRDFEAFERARQIDCAVMDKTGTLTRGRWSLDSVACHGDLAKGEALALAAGLEQGLDHVVARAVREYARNLGVRPDDIHDIEVHATGVRGRWRSRILEFGAPDFVGDIDGFSSVGKTGKGLLSPVYMRLDGRPAATFFFGDRVRESAASLVRDLETAGVACHMVSGDARAVTRAVARRVGIDSRRVHGGRLPRQKACFVAGLQKSGHRVVMVGDGTNDAPALAAADLSVAVHNESSLAYQAAAVTLMRSDPAQLMDFLALARLVNRKVVENLGCAWIYNLIAIPVAMAGWLNPLVATAAMLLSSLTVIGNTLHLLRRKEP